MKKLLVSMYFAYTALFISAQELATISGRVYDKGTGEILPYATVTLNSTSDSIMLAGTLAGDDGRFVLSGILQGEYRVSCSFIGYTSEVIPLLVGELNYNFDLGRVELSSSASDLDAVIVEAKQAVISADLDRKRYSIENNIAQSGGSVLDAMKGLPGITACCGLLHRQQPENRLPVRSALHCVG